MTVDTQVSPPPPPLADPEQQALLDSVERAPEDIPQEPITPEPEPQTPTEPTEPPAPDTPESEAPDETPAPLPENWHEREEVQAKLKDSHSEGWRKGYSKADIAAKAQIDALTQRARIYDGLQDLIKAVEQVAENGGLLVDDDRARRSLADLLARSPALAEAVKLSEPELKSEGQSEVVNAFMSLTATTLPKDQQEDMTKYTTQLMADTKVGIEDSEQFWPSLFKKRDALVTKAAFDKGRQAGIDAERKANGKATAANARAAIKGPESPGGAGGGLTPEAYRAKLARGEQPTTEEIDAMTASFLK